MRRLVAGAIAFFAAYHEPSPALAQVANCTSEGGDVTCPAERYQLLRDKARVGQLFCESLDTGTLPHTLPSELEAVCESASLTSRIWAKAQTMQEHRKAAREAQREANRAKGRVTELQASNDRMLVRIERLAGDRREARQGWDRWWAVGLSAVGVASLSSVVVTGDVVGWWDF
jgi:hypothetical protein